MQKHIMLDPKRESYIPFFDDDFPELAFRASDDNTELYEIVFDLVAEWRSLSYASALPATIPAALAAFHDGYTNDVGNQTGILKFADTILKKVALEAPDLTSDPETQKRLHDKLVNIAGEITAINENLDIRMNADSVWQAYLSLVPFTLGLSGTLRVVFIAMYSAYENFVVRCLSCANDGQQFKITKHKKFEEAFRGTFGNLFDECWGNEDFRPFRLVRNSFVHAGGRVTNQLRDVDIPVVVYENRLHVYPEHIRALYSVLKNPALKLISHPSFHQSSEGAT